VDASAVVLQEDLTTYNSTGYMTVVSTAGGSICVMIKGYMKKITSENMNYNNNDFILK